jgi:Family of unknown function (DUF6084)
VPDLDFAVQSAEPVPYAAAPLLALKLAIRNTQPDQRIASIMLQCQIQIETPRRHYSPQEQARLLDLFGEPDRWSQTLRNTLWTHAGVNVGPFQSETLADLPVPCTFDFNIGATKYFHALEDGEVPLCLLFSGTMFFEHPSSGLQIAQIPWNKEARFRLPVTVWKNVVDMYYPNTAWLALHRDAFNRLHDYKMRHGVATWEEALDRLLAASEEEVRA